MFSSGIFVFLCPTAKGLSRVDPQNVDAFSLYFLKILTKTELNAIPHSHHPSLGPKVKDNSAFVTDKFYNTRGIPAVMGYVQLDCQARTR